MKIILESNSCFNLQKQASSKRSNLKKDISDKLSRLTRLLSFGMWLSGSLITVTRSTIPLFQSRHPNTSFFKCLTDTLKLLLLCLSSHFLAWRQLQAKLFPSSSNCEPTCEVTIKNCFLLQEDESFLGTLLTGGDGGYIYSSNPETMPEEGEFTGKC